MSNKPIDVAGAYRKQANLKAWVRTIRLNRGRNITVGEDYTLEKRAKEITLTLLTPCRAVVEKDGQLLLETANGTEPRTGVRVWFDGGRLEPTLEMVPVADGRLRAVWPEQLTRILLKAEQPALHDTWTLRMERAQGQQEANR